MRLLLSLLIALLAGSCGTAEVKDTNAQVDARPECVGSAPARPGDKVPPWCKRETTTTWSSGESRPLDLSGKKHDDD